MASLKVVCLISGGKDSLFSILHCLKNGHEVVALANLHPPLSEDGSVVEDLDSYMYQTIGHRVIPLYEEALGLPLYRQEIAGTHVNQDKSYGPASTTAAKRQDETEALIPLLQKVKTSHPEVNAVSTGAILSDYQRTRVESVAIRLGLVPLAFLWQWPSLALHSESSLLDDMAAVGQDARIIKVASGGLDESFLWQNVADRRTIHRLQNAARRFGSLGDGAVLGEGGEYETLAIAGPAPLWKRRITIEEQECTTVPSGAGAAYLQMSGARLQANAVSMLDISELRIPPILNETSAVLLDSLPNIETGRKNLTSPKARPMSTDSSASELLPNHVLLANLTGDGANPAQQTHSIMDEAIEKLRLCGHVITDIIYTTIILRDMADFASINSAYGFYFKDPNPPVRVTVGCAAVLPKNKDVMIALTSVKHENLSHRRALHVQSRSYWAPANIGPYSQAMSVLMESDAGIDQGSLVYIAGQIPLVPSSMELPQPQDNGGNDPFSMQTVLAVQHFVRIGRVMQVRKWVYAVAFITAGSPEEAVVRSNIVRRAWEDFQRLPDSSTAEPTSDDESDTFDVWDQRFGNARKSDRHLEFNGLPIRKDNRADYGPSLYVIQVDVLPRGASIEWVTYGMTSVASSSPTVPHLQYLLQLFRQKSIGPFE